MQPFYWKQSVKGPRRSVQSQAATLAMLRRAAWKNIEAFLTNGHCQTAKLSERHSRKIAHFGVLPSSRVKCTPRFWMFWLDECLFSIRNMSITHWLSLSSTTLAVGIQVANSLRHSSSDRWGMMVCIGANVPERLFMMGQWSLTSRDFIFHTLSFIIWYYIELFHCIPSKCTTFLWIEW